VPFQPPVMLAKNLLARRVEGPADGKRFGLGHLSLRSLLPMFRFVPFLGWDAIQDS
jgi:hypothetical protein